VEAEPVFFPEGAADSAGRAGYVGDGGGIVAVGLADGRALWRTDRARRPLLVAGDRLVAARELGDRPNALRVVVLDPDGAPVLASEPVVFPEWVAVTDRERFRLGTHLECHRLRIEWEAHARYGGGAPPPPEIRRAAAHDAGGVVAVDLESGAVGPASDVQPGGVRRPPVDDVEEPWLAGATVVRAVWEVEDGDQVLRIERSDLSAPERSTVVEVARGDGLVAEATPDGRHLFVHAEPGPGTWSCVSVETGEHVAELTCEPGAHSPAILGARVYYLVDAAGSRMLKARELATDAVAWELSLSERRPSEPRRLRP
jgi:hypothetical protein